MPTLKTIKTIFVLEDPTDLNTHTPRQAITMHRLTQKHGLINVDLEDFEPWLQTFTR